MRHTLKFSKLFYFICLLGVSFFLTSCGDDDESDDPTPVLEIPTEYNFENVSYSGQTQRLDMFTELKSYMTTSRTGGQLDADVLQAMFANDASAPWTKTYDASKQLRSKTLSSVQTQFDDLLTELAAASQSTVTGSDGVSGVIQSTDGAKSYLVGDDGLDHAQVFEKGLMGACLYYQATSVYMGPDRMDVDNETIEPGEGTEMEHHWDEAFGYFGVPTDFPANTDNLSFWGNYSNNRNAILESNQKLMDALLKGRAAISEKDLTIRDEAIAEARAEWELISVGSALHYLNSGISNFDDMALRSHALSEGIGFIYSLQFNTAQKITNAQVNDLLTLIAGASDFAQMNLYNAEVAKLQQAKDQLADYYGLTAQKDEF